jgi:PhnB protein
MRLHDLSPPAAPPGPGPWLGVIPYLGLAGRALAAAAFYARAFGAREIARIGDPDDPARVLHCALEINGGCLMLTDCPAPWEARPSRPRGVTLQLVVADGDAWWDRASAAGCAPVLPFARMAWGDRWGLLEDPFGIAWAIDEPAGGAPEAAAAQRLEGSFV